MNFFRVLAGYLKWHYTRALVSTTQIWQNLFYFLLSFFSIKTLLHEYFSPWKRNADQYKKGFHIKAFFEVFIVNTLMRIFGIVARSIILVVGFFVCLVFIVLYPVVMIIWLALPVLVIYFFILGLVLIFL